MSRVRTRDTQPELALRHHLSAAGIRGYRLHRRDVLGKPDVAWLSRKVAVFVDGAFWHGHPSAFKTGQSGAFWDRKISGNVERDVTVSASLREAGWTVLRFWDFEVARDPEGCVRRVRTVLEVGANK